MRCSEFFRRFAAVVLGAVFLFGGVLKLMDPVGATLVMNSYLGFLHLSSLSFAAEALALSFTILECIVGVALVSGVLWRWIKWLSFGLTLFFALLTLLLLIANPAMDCGCFGELVHLTHIQSFLKNIVLLLLWCAVFLPRGWNIRQPRRRRVLALVDCVLLFVLMLHGFNRLPVLDLTDLNIGTELTEGSIPILGEDDEYHDDMLLDGDVLLVSVPSPLSAKDREKVMGTLDLARKSGLEAALLAPMRMSEFEGLPLYTSDRKTLLSLNRSNGGATLVRDGEIVRKWSLGALDADKLERSLEMDPIESIADDSLRGRISFGSFVVVVFALLLI